MTPSRPGQASVSEAKSPAPRERMVDVDSSVNGTMSNAVEHLRDGAES